MIKRQPLRFLVFCGLAVLYALPVQAAGLEGDDTFIRRVMADWQVPGLAVIAIKDGRVVLQKGYGVRAVGGTQPVTPKTLFALGSITKTVTVAGLMVLAEQGKLDWDAPLSRLLPGFRLNDPETTRTVTPRHLVSHQTGLPRHDVLWYVEAFSRAEMVRRLRYLKATAQSATVFQYNNLMVMTAGVLAGHIAGTSWEDFTRRTLLEPLGMRAAHLSLDAFRQTPDRAEPYILTQAGRVALGLRNTDAIAPASGLYANADDLSLFLNLLLAKGGKVLSAPRVAAMLQPQIKAPGGDGGAELGPRQYGMGLFVTTYRGHRLAYHPGFIDGYGARLSMLPDRDIGVLVLTNLSGLNRAPTVVSRYLLDRLLGLEPVPWNDRLLAAYRQNPVSNNAPLKTGAPAHPLSAYEGAYGHPGYGTIQIVGKGNGLAGRIHKIDFELLPMGGDRWRVAETAWPLRQGLVMTFEVDKGRLLTPLADGPSYPYKVGAVAFQRVDQL